MKTTVDLEECLRDSPAFRKQLEVEENDLDILETKLDKVLKNCGLMIDNGKSYVAQQSLFANSLWELSLQFNDEPKVMSALNRFNHVLQEMNKFHTILLDQASRTVLKNLTSFVKLNIKSVKESKHYFEKISNDLDSALIKNSQVSKNRPLDIEEMDNLLTATRSCFRHTALDYVHALTMLKAKKKHEVLSTFLSYMHACCTFYHQGADFCEDLDPFLKTVADNVSLMRIESKELEKEMENRHSVVHSHDSTLPSSYMNRESEGHGSMTLSTMPKNSTKPQMQGYLFKRTSNAFKTWNRRWFYLYDNQLVYRKRTGEEQVTVMEEDLRLCTVKYVSEGERRFCFEVLSPSKSHMLQADSEDMLSSWVSALQNGIRVAIQRGLSTLAISDSNTQALPVTKNTQSSNTKINPSRKVRMWEQLLSIPGNNICCDCSSPNPRWASINLGITLCIECSGVHRSLGVHHSKVRSLTLDEWEGDAVKVMAELGNRIVNQVYEATVSENSSIIKATPNCSSIIREAWIKSKYVSLSFVSDLNISEESKSNRQTRHDSKSEENSNEAVDSGNRKWSVKKVRRRPRSRPRNRQVIKEVDLSDLGDTANEALESNQAISSNSDLHPDKSDADNKKSDHDHVLLIGTELNMTEPPTGIALPSDQDSTEGDESDANIEEEDISALTPSLLLYRAAGAHNLPVMCRALALRADPHTPHPHPVHHGRTPLHAAVLSGSVMACSYLLMNGSRINTQDSLGKTPLHLATDLGNTAQVCLLLRYKADQNLKDIEGNTPLDIAVTNANADIVTLLRLTKLNEEMKESDMGALGDETYNEVFRDYTQMAHSHPERLIRSNNRSSAYCDADANNEDTPNN